MKLRLIFLASLVAVALITAAPVAKQPEVKITKRAEEVITFGNHQNAPRLKKRDPSIADGKADLETDAKMPADLQEVAASKTPEDASAGNPLDGESDSGDDNSLGKSSQPVAENTDSSDADVEAPVNAIAFDESMMGDFSNEPDTTNEIPQGQFLLEPETDDVDEFLARLKNEQVPDGKPEKDGQKVNNTTDLSAAVPSNDEDDYLSYYNYLSQLNTIPNNLQDYAQYNRKRRNAPGGLTLHHFRRPHRQSKIISQNRRIKRDLMDDADLQYYPYPIPPQFMTPVVYPEEIYPSTLLEELEERPEAEEEQREKLLEEFLELKAEEEKEEREKEAEAALGLYNLAYLGEQADLLPVYMADNDEAEPEVTEDIEPLVKRQLLSELPGMKKRYFYPYSREPETHWGAFMSQKREYDSYRDAYARVLNLARELGEEESSDSYLDNYTEEEKK